MSEDQRKEDLSNPKTKLILIADDDGHVRGFLEAFVQNEGFQVAVAKDGAEALKKVGECNPDLIITDLKMPGQGGYEFLRSLQGDSTVRIPVFVITATALDRSTIEMIRNEANVVEFLPKPVQIHALMAALHRQLKTLPPGNKRWED